ncbi:MAG: trp operon repressor [Xanthomonadaceae bacterium]|jgi:TrpR-related protein YerC/YecD|nr:trp operon repressor [Xanthomonadaceae bacterium]
MKQRPQPLPDDDAKARLDALAQVFADLKKADDVKAFLRDLCTPAELEAMTDRWRVVPLLLKNIPYREIHELTRVSVTTIGRVARTLEHGAGGYAAAVDRCNKRAVSFTEKTT